MAKTRSMPGWLEDDSELVMVDFLRSGIPFSFGVREGEHLLQFDFERRTRPPAGEKKFAYACSGVGDSLWSEGHPGSIWIKGDVRVDRIDGKRRLKSLPLAWRNLFSRAVDGDTEDVTGVEHWR